MTSVIPTDKSTNLVGSVRHAFDNLDLLQLPLIDTAFVSRDAGQFRLERAWSIAHFGQHVLKPGWWIFESQSQDAGKSVELRLTSALNPLLTLTNDHNGRVRGGVRIYLPAPEAFDVSVLLSAWPGQLHFSKLCFRRLSIAEMATLFASGLKRLLNAKNGYAKLVHLALQFLRRRPVGLRLDPPSANSQMAASPFTPSTLTTDEKPLRFLQCGDIGVVLGAEDTLDARALQIVSEEFRRSTHLHAIYCDVLEGKVIAPRPIREAELSRWFEVATPPLFFRADSQVEHVSVNQRLKIVIDRWGPGAVGRIPLPLVMRPTGHWPVLPTVQEPKLSRLPKVSIIIPTKYRIDLLEKCLEGLAGKTEYSKLEIVIVDNGSIDHRLPGILERTGRIFDLIHVRDMGKFNFSRLVNLGVRTSSGEVILLMNDDVQPTQSGWLHRMIESVMSADVGAVGARLLFPDRTIQHAGVSMGIGGICGHLWKGLSEQEALRCPYIVYPGERMAVTGACLAVRRDVYDRVGGFDEAAFPVGLNDIDFCLRVRALGLRNIYRGDAVLIHHESQSRGQDSETAERRHRAGRENAAFLSRWRPLIQDDPFSSPEFDCRTQSGAVHYAALAGAPNSISEIESPACRGCAASS